MLRRTKMVKSYSDAKWWCYVKLKMGRSSSLQSQDMDMDMDLDMDMVLL